MPGIKDWLRKAAGDLKLATKAVGDDETLDPAVYLTHQCVEKALKAFFVLFGKTIPRTHDLEVLLYDCAKIDQEFLLLQNECGFLSPYNIVVFTKDEFDKYVHDATSDTYEIKTKGKVLYARGVGTSDGLSSAVESDNPVVPA